MCPLDSCRKDSSFCQSKRELSRPDHLLYGSDYKYPKDLMHRASFLLRQNVLRLR